MNVRTHEDPGTYWEDAKDLFLANEALHGVAIGVAETLRTQPGVYPKFYLWTMTHGSAVVGAAWCTPPHPLGLTSMSSDAVDALAAHLESIGFRPTAVYGPRPAADEFTALWTAARGTTLRMTMDQLVYEVTRVVAPTGVAGAARLAASGDLDLLHAWAQAFNDELHLSEHVDVEVLRRDTERRIAEGARHVWIVDGRVVSHVAVGWRSPSGQRIAGVYTPPEARRRGHASALVAHVTQQLLDGGCERCFLTTDRANATSNGVYTRIGYRAVGETVWHSLEPAP